MEDQIKSIELFFTINAISSKSFYCITMWPNTSQIDFQGYFNSNLGRILARFTTGELGNDGFIRFNFNYNNYQFKITLT
jgi:hypothetical protein